MTRTSVSFIHVTAFSSDPFRGNPATIAFLDPDTPLPILQGLARNFNQPMAAFVRPINTTDPSDPTKIKTDIRYFTANGHEPPLCGHATLAATKAILSLPAFKELGEEVKEVEFGLRSGLVVRAVREGEGRFELTLPTGGLVGVGEEEERRLRDVLERAAGRKIQIDYVARGVDSFDHVAFFVIDEKEDLQNLVFNKAILTSETGATVNIVTSKPLNASDKGEKFVCRMFSSEVVDWEDPVCGSAHCVLTPYWSTTLGLTPGQQFVSRQVSPRGGYLYISWDNVENKLKLAGEATILGEGVYYFEA